MRHLPLALKYRPKTFDEIVDQDYIKRILKNQVEHGLAFPAFIFAGPRGIGKTTTARVFARSLNCLNGPTVNPCGECPACREIIEGRSVDVIEIDGASNRGIDQVRELREQVKYVPLQGRYKIYIIDEVHMLTTEAFNALLKTLEEPPPHAIFILATTAPAKVPQTVLSRCQRFDFRRIGVEPIAHRLREIADRENIKIGDDAIRTIARYADGSMRDGLVILEQLTGYTEDEIKREDVLDVVGKVPDFAVLELFQSVNKKDKRKALEILTQMMEGGNEPFEIYRALIEYLRHLLFIQSGVDEPLGEGDQLLAEGINPLDLLRMLQVALNYEDLLRRSSSPRVVMEALILRFIYLESSVMIDDLLKYYEGRKKDIVQTMVDDLERIDKELAASLRQAEIHCEQNQMVVYTRDPKIRDQLLKKRQEIETVLKRIAGGSVRLRMEERSLKEKVISFFDGEEVK
ncbi:DNA polymerase III subunit gamma/tau [candidate division WOR-3 bacterium]|uniref:DNA polymerase III subunit gamma/tau n=1 Tax=candidate division WOR-3 bacterium TaxID=2052148 RepID=A0A660SM16_UNCW3|nr:MAG: DNA polymerase III subunit gamma/tau [candidate division WOR-3 bacterium]